MPLDKATGDRPYVRPSFTPRFLIRKDNMTDPEGVFFTPSWPRPGRRCVLCLTAWAYRRCRVCGRWVCRGCRFGAGWLVRCARCPPEQLIAILQEEAAARREARTLRCRHCATPFAWAQKSGWRVHRPACHCWRAELELGRPAPAVNEDLEDL